MAEKPGALDGTLMRGADGKLYFIPRQELSRFEVPQHVTGKVEDAVEQGSAPGVNFTDSFLNPLAQANAPDDDMYACEGLGQGRRDRG